MERHLIANIWKFYLFNIFSGFVFYYAIDKVFMESRGLSITDIVLVEISYTIARLVLEVPSGALADRWSRKYVLALNMVFFMGNTFLWVIAHNISLFILGSLVASMHSALKSGTDTSFLYDTLKQLNKSEDYIKIQGNVIFWENLLAIGAGIAGGMIAGAFGLAVPFWITLPFSFGAVIIALSFTEPQIQRTTGDMGYWKHIAETGKYLWRNHFLVNLVLFSVIIEASILLIDEYSQLYFVEVGVSIFALGYLAAVGNGIEAIAGKFAYHLEGFSRKKIFGMAIAISAIGFIFVGLTKSWYVVAFAFLPFLGYYFAYPLALNDLHNELPSGQRATGESFMSLIRGIVYVPFAFAFGRTADGSSISNAYLMVGVLVAVYLVVFLVSYRNKTKADLPVKLESYYS